MEFIAQLSIRNKLNVARLMNTVKGIGSLVRDNP